MYNIGKPEIQVKTSPKYSLASLNPHNIFCMQLPVITKCPTGVK